MVAGRSSRGRPGRSRLRRRVTQRPRTGRRSRGRDTGRGPRRRGPGRDGAQGRERARWTARRSGGPGWAGSAPRDAGSWPPDAAAEHNKAVPPPPPTAPHPPSTGPVDSRRPAGRLDRGTGRDRAGGAPSGQTSRPRPLTSGSALQPRRHPGPRLRDLARRETGRRWRQWLLTP